MLLLYLYSFYPKSILGIVATAVIIIFINKNNKIDFFLI